MVNSFETAKEKLTAYLTETKKSKTIARYNVLKAVYEQKSCFTAEELYQQINANSKDRVCFATVYNTLLILQDCKLIVKYRLDNAVSQYYEVASETEYHHSSRYDKEQCSRYCHHSKITDTLGCL